MPTETILTTHQKALQINLDGLRFGTFAEIGAGQEVVRWFFRVGGAAGTIAKSMSAYDMTVSDAIYGKSPRYVSKERLLQMLDHEFQLNKERLSGNKKLLFAFADTVAARSFHAKSSNDRCWMGIRFQTDTDAPPSQVVIHVRLLDHDNLLQQEAIGMVGVNLIHACFYSTSHPTHMIASLLDNLSRSRVEVDMIEFSGPAFDGVDNRLMALQLVKSGVSDVAMFDAEGKVLQPTDLLYKKPILIERGTFRPVTHTHIDILISALPEFKRDFKENGENAIALMEITMKNLLETADSDPRDFLDRADVLATIGQPVLITSFSEFHRLISYLRSFTQEPIALAMGGAAVRELFDPKYYQDLPGGALEGLGRLFRENVRAYVYPQQLPSGEILSVDNFMPPGPYHHLFSFVRERGFLETVKHFSANFSPFSSRDVLARIRANDSSWEDLVPAPVAGLIKNRNLFGYKPSV
jgi:hypothetical protein